MLQPIKILEAMEKSGSEERNEREKNGDII
jgi:hypothetical protein